MSQDIKWTVFLFLAFGIAAVCALQLGDRIYATALQEEVHSLKGTMVIMLATMERMTDRIDLLERQVSTMQKQTKLTIEQIARDRRPHINITSDSVDGVRVYNTMGEIQVSQGHDREWRKK